MTTKYLGLPGRNDPYPSSTWWSLEICGTHPLQHLGSLGTFETCPLRNLWGVTWLFQHLKFPGVSETYPLQHLGILGRLRHALSAPEGPWGLCLSGTQV